MRALILAGGFATRLRPLSCSKPKLLFPIVGVPLITSMASWLHSGGVNEIILAVNHFSDRLKMDIGPEKKGVKVTYSLEEVPLGTAGPVKLAEGLVGQDGPFFVINGDVATNIDLRAMLALHKQRGASATIALVYAPDPAPYGSVVTDFNGIVKEFEEKSSTAPSKMVNAGVYVIEPSVMSMIPAGRAVSLERDIFPRLAKTRVLESWKHDGFWYDIGRISEYIRANKELLKVRGSSAYRGKDPSSIIKPVFLGEQVVLGASTTVGPDTIMGNNTSLGERSVVRNSIIFEDTRIGAGTVVDGAVIGENVTIGDHSRIGPNSIVAGQLSIPSMSTIAPNSILFC